MRVDVCVCACACCGRTFECGGSGALLKPSVDYINEPKEKLLVLCVCGVQVDVCGV